MRTTLLSALVTGLSLLPLAHASADVRITISDGFVSVDAKDATVRQILAEWARVGQTRVVNAERIVGAPVSLRLVRVPEAQALDILLRSVSGYMAAPRAVPVENASQFDRILVMPTSAPPRAAAAAPLQAAAPPFQSPQVPNPIDDIEMDDPGGPPQGIPAQRGPVFPQFPNPVNGGPPGGPGGFPQRGPAFPQGGTPFPNPNSGQPQTVSPNQPFPPSSPGSGGAVPGGFVMPPGVATPGMVAPTPQPGQLSPEPQ